MAEFYQLIDGILYQATAHSAANSETLKALPAGTENTPLHDQLTAFAYNLPLDDSYHQAVVAHDYDGLKQYLVITAIRVKTNWHIYVGNQRLLAFAFGQRIAKQADSARAVIDLNGTVLDCNGAFEQLLEHPAMTAASLHELAASLRQQQDLQTCQHTSSTQDPLMFDCTCIDATLQLWSIECQLIATKTQQHLYNFEELQLARRQAEQASEAKSRFLANMSHEIRSPLNAIINMAQLLLNTPLNKKQKQYATVAYSGGQTLLSLVNDILDVSKIEAGHLTLNEAPFDIVATLEDLITLFWSRAHEQDLELCLTIEPDIAGCYLGDEQRCRQIFINLINNAIKFTEYGGITVSLKRSSQLQGVALCVSDTGIGMTPDEIQTIFDAFIQAQSSESRQYTGTGLGLSIVKQLTEIMGGQVEVRSVLGYGSAFTLHLPLLAMDTDLSTIKLKADTAPTTKQLAIIDCANTALQQTLTSQCEYYGIPCINYANISAAIDQHYDAIFILGEADENDCKAKEYHQFAERYVHARSVQFIGLSNFHFSEQIKTRMFRVFTHILDRPILPSSLFQLFFHGHKPQVHSQSVAPELHTRILLVEDGETNRAVASALLEHIGIACDSAHNGSDAITMCAKQYYPLILMDLAMPVMDGLEATTHIREGNSVNKETPIIALTANAFAEDRATCLAAGMNDYISKPINSEIFYQKVQQWLGKSPTQSSATELSTNGNKPSSQATTDAVVDTRVLQQLIKDTSAHSLKVILDIYCKEIEERIPQMELLMNQEIWATLADEAHILKSSSASFGAVELSSRAKIIELGVRAGELDQVRAAMRNIDELAMTTLCAQRQFLQQVLPNAQH